MIKVVRKMAMASAGAISSVLIFWATHASAQQSITLTDPLGGNESFTSVATAVAAFLFWDIAMPLSVIMVLVGAFQLMTSAGEPEKVSRGRKTLLYAVIGLAVALIAGSVTTIIQNFVNGKT